MAKRIAGFDMKDNNVLCLGYKRRSEYITVNFPLYQPSTHEADLKLCTRAAKACTLKSVCGESFVPTKNLFMCEWRTGFPGNRPNQCCFVVETLSTGHAGMFNLFLVEETLFED